MSIAVPAGKPELHKSLLWRSGPLGWLVFLCGSAVSLVLFTLLWHMDVDRRESDFRSDARARIAELRHDVEHIEDVVFALRTYLGGAEHRTLTDFDEYASAWIASHPGVQALLWAPRIAARQSERHEIFEQDAEGRARRAGARDSYYPIDRAFQTDPAARIVAYDLGSEPESLVALERARDTGRPTATRTARLVSPSRQKDSFLLVWPVYRRGQPEATVQQRRDALEGFVAGTFRLTEVLRTSLEHAKHGPALGVEIYDVDPDSIAEPIYASRSDAALHQGGWRAQEAVRLGDRNWTIVVAAMPGSYSTKPEADAWAVLLIGMIGTIVATYFAQALTDRSRRLERSVVRSAQEVEFSTALIDSLPGLFTMIDADGRLVRWNKNFQALTGRRSEELRGSDAVSLVAPEDRDSVGRALRDAFGGGVEDTEFDMPTASGGSRATHWTGRTIARDGRTHMISIGIDVTERNAAEAALLESRQIMEGIFNATPVRLFWKDRNLVYLGCNSAFAADAGFTDPKDIIGKTDFDMGWRAQAARYHADDRRVIDSGQPKLMIEEPLTMPDGRIITLLTSKLPLRRANGEIYGVLGAYTDISERKRIEEQVRLMARRDILTGLANRAEFVERLEEEIARARRSGTSFAVLYLDLDHFKDVNDTLGHPIGDLLLQTVARRLKAMVRETDVVARFGGDEFAIIVSHLGEPSDAAVIAENLLSALGDPYMINDNEIHSGASIGIAIYGPDGPDAEALLTHADVALYRVKAEGRGSYRFFTEKMDAEVRSRVTLVTELREALQKNQFFLVYHPQADVTTGRMVGFEALLRWNHPRRGVVMPAEFIDTAEKSGLIVPIGHWVLHEACRQTKEWLDAGGEPTRVAVNLSAVQFKVPLSLEREIMSILTETGLPSTMLELEFTESVLMESSADHQAVLLRLRKAGVRIAMDDFGTGYSSLSYLSAFPVDLIKIAQTFMLDLKVNSGNAAIVKAAIGLAHDLGLDVVVEGVETEDQLRMITAWGGRKVQGYYFSKPLAASDMANLLLRGHSLLPTKTSCLPVPITAAPAPSYR